MHRRSWWMWIWVAAVVLIAGAAGCSKKPPAGEIVPPPATSTQPGTPGGSETPAVSPGASGTEAGQHELADAFFEYNKYTLTLAARDALANNAERLMQDPNLRLLIEGHCDERGTREYNLALGDRRANAARDFLISYGIDAHRIETISYGKERPFDSGHDESAWSKNRRAHFVIRR